MAVEKYLVVLTIVGLVDAISYMLVTPSLVFYVLQNGGTHVQYGIIMSAFSFSSFCTKPFIGWWSDQKGFRVPYITSVIVALMGGVGYFLASALPPGDVAVNAILVSRLLGGCGAANSALGYAYVARSVPQNEQTQINSLLSLCRILGMALGPGLNVLVATVNIPITPYWKLDSLNSVGIVLVIANLISSITIFTLLEEPKEEDIVSAEVESESTEDEKDVAGDAKDTTTAHSKKTDAVLSFLSADLLVPMLSIFAFNANFQVIETAFAPAANDALGWGPVKTSLALGSLSVMIAINMYNVMRLSKKGFSDSSLLCGGLVASIVAYSLVYLLWVKDSTAFHFVLPILLSASSFPYMMATTRSIFTVSVNAKPALNQYHGFLQAVLSMAASVAGFTTPGLVAAYMLRSPEEVLSSNDLRELTPVSLFAPALSLAVLLGMLYLRVTGAVDGAPAALEGSEPREAQDEESSTPLTESSSLLPSSNRHSSIRSKQKRRSSNIAIMLEGKFDGGLFEESLTESAREL